ncbi:MAG: GxxExxY protein [Acidimicrobiia bacterium]|nr:GxxExxY protein [Acidimicrobiia bacterium]
MIPRDTVIDRLTWRVIACAIEVHREMGPGLLESIYRECLLLELANDGLHRNDTEGPS